jgi:hypothetical protein
MTEIETMVMIDEPVCQQSGEEQEVGSISSGPQPKSPAVEVIQAEPETPAEAVNASIQEQEQFSVENALNASSSSDFMIGVPYGDQQDHSTSPPVKEGRTPQTTEDQYDEIVIEEEDEETEYIDEILLDDDYLGDDPEEPAEEEFTEVTMESLGGDGGVITTANGGVSAAGGEDDVGDEEYVEVDASEQPLDSGSLHALVNVSIVVPAFGSADQKERLNGSSNSIGGKAPSPSTSPKQGKKASVAKRHVPVLKSAAQKQAELVAAEKEAEEERARALREQLLAKQRDLEVLAEEEARLRQEEEKASTRLSAEREEKRKEKERRASQIAAAEIAKQIANEQEEEKKQKRQEEEDRRKAEEEKHRLAAAAKAAAMKEAAECARKEAEAEAQRRALFEQKRLEAEARRLEAEMEAARKAAEAAKQKEEEEKKRLQAKINERRAAAKERLARASRAVENKSDDALPSMFAASKKMAESSKATVSKPVAILTDSITTFYSVEQLRAQSVPGLDYKNREIYLSDDDFAKLFECTKAEFAEYPAWKRTNLKRKLKLF